MTKIPCFKNKNMKKEKFYWLNEDSRTFLSRGYLRKGEKAEDRYREISEAAESILGEKGFAEKFYDYLSRGFYSLSTPVTSNYGRKDTNNTGVSCFSSMIPDSTDEILRKAGEVGIMSKWGGGTSGFFGKVRPRGSRIVTGGGETDGPVRFMEIFDKVTDVISQGSSRRGSFAAYLPVDHPDIMEFLRIREEGHPIQKMSIGITVPDDWMDSMIEGDKEKRSIWAAIVRKKYETGYPYIIYTGNANKQKPQWYKDQNMEIYNSNLCVAPETIVTTSKGDFKIEELEDRDVEVWNGEEWSNVTIKKTGYSQKFVHLVFVDENGTEKYINATEYHKFYLDDGSEVRTKDLNIGDRLEKFKDQNGRNVNLNLVYKSIFTRSDDTYCATEPKRHRILFNGILTGQCSEIFLPTTDNESFVCVLSCLNLLHWDEIEKTDAPETLLKFLWTVNEEFVRKTKNVPYMEDARRFAEKHRAIGLGVLGWHSLLQSKMIPFESMDAKYLNNKIFAEIQKRMNQTNKDLVEVIGECEVTKGYGVALSTTMSLPPTTSSSFILGQVSQSIEPLNSNYFVKRLAKGNFTYKNPFLKELLSEKGKDDSDTWRSVLERGGSVQHLDFLSQQEKDVFKTFGELSQKEIIIQAAQRQKYIDQGQSLNIMVGPKVPAKEVSDLMIEAWRLGVKSLYYQRGANPSQELARSLNTCTSCEG